jgi:hypothetical protein
LGGDFVAWVGTNNRFHFHRRAMSTQHAGAQQFDSASQRGSQPPPRQCDEPGRLAFNSLNALIQWRVQISDTASPIIPGHRRLLVTFAERNINRTPDKATTAKSLCLGRLQALYVAGALGMLDAPAMTSPFQNLQRAAAYVEQRRYMTNLQPAPSTANRLQIFELSRFQETAG